MTEAEERRDHIQAIRGLANFFYRHPEFRIPDISIGIHVGTKKEMTSLTAEGTWQKEHFASYFYMRRSFGPSVCLWVAVDRELVCERTVTGTKWVEPQPATPGYEEETVEWICPDSIMNVGGGHGSS